MLVRTHVVEFKHPKKPIKIAHAKFKCDAVHFVQSFYSLSVYLWNANYKAQD